MTVKFSLASEGESVAPGMDNEEAVSVLAVGEASEWRQQGHALPGAGITFVAFQDVSEVMLGNLNPEVIFSPILARSFDCIELAILLHNLGFRGAYRAIARDLPKPGLIEREVSQICPRLDFRIVISK